jgi:hypothetical protein
MPGAPPVVDRTALWAALSSMQIPDLAAARRLEAAVAEEQGWSLAFAERVGHEYRRFLYLAATAGFEVTPSRAVDQVWHRHLATRHYEEILCGRILRRPLDHRAGTGAAEEEERYRRQYEDTLALYPQVFGCRPPPDIWPDPVAGLEPTDEEGKEDELDSAREQGRILTRRIAVGSLAASLPALAFGTVPAVILIGVAFALFLLAQPSVASGRGRESGGCGAGCAGGSWGVGGDDCGGGSCGGASCGCGGCGGGCGGS